MLKVSKFCVLFSNMASSVYHIQETPNYKTSRIRIMYLDKLAFAVIL